MKKIRINELARELEVKPNRILELLPGLGVSEKKTHSSSIDEDVAIQVRNHFGVHGVGEDGSGPDEHDGHEHDSETEKPEVRPAAREERKAEVAAPAAQESAEQPTDARAAETEETQLSEVPHADSALAAHDRVTPRTAPQPLRPPLGAQGTQPVSVPPGPIHPPLTTPGQAPPKASQPPQAQQPPQQQDPVRPPAAQIAPGAPRPAAGQPSARPGQILSGPRAPLPLSPAAPGPPRPPQTPVRPQQPIAQQRQPRPQAPGPRPTGQPGAPAHSPQPRPATLAGQPAARPVVPPRPDLVARLQQQQSPKMPGAPQPPRPGMPQRPSGTPVPGQPIYRGPIRPGQPLMRGPGAPGPGGPGRPQRGRQMHPTSTPLRMEPATLPPTEQRRHQAKPGGRIQVRDRELEKEGKLRLPSSRKQELAPPPIDREITVAEGVTVKELSEKLGVRANLVIKKLVERKIFATINQTLDVKLAEELARAFGASTNKVSYEEESIQEIELQEGEKDLVRRAPVVTIMGHVDHGKTSLLDAIRLTNVAAREAGGITQHIGAYQVEKNGRKVVFIDTPGHEAFTRMRARGAKVTDIVILVVAADDGVMPQTLEAIDHAKAAKVPIIVAINKIDKPDAQPERIKQQLADRGLLAEDWGGDVVMVPVSAKASQNLDLLLEMILLVADMQDLKANPNRPGIGSVLEAQLDRGRGPVATVLVRNGTLRVGDHFICGSVFGKVRAMFSDLGQPVRDAEPSTPVEVLGLDSLPEVGDTFQVVTDTAKAKQIVIYRESKAREQAMARTNRVTLDQLHGQLREGEVKELNVILKADVGGTSEVLSDTLQKLSTDKVKIKVLHSGVGAITETDVLLASASNAIVVGFNVRPERNAAALAEQEKVDIRLHTIIYELTDEIKRAMTGMLEPVFKEVYRGRAEVREVFRVTKVGTVAGCMVLDGVLTRDSQVRLLRDNVVIHTGKIQSLKRFKNDATEVKSGFECGVGIANYNDLKPGDIIEAFVTERVASEALV
ncbi:MAG: translation initiation factor IF-2 [Bryobacteraceae bacterium]